MIDPEDMPEDDLEEVVIPRLEEMPVKQLAQRAADLGLKVPKSADQTRIIDALRDHSREIAYQGALGIAEDRFNSAAHGRLAGRHEPQ